MRAPRRRSIVPFLATAGLVVLLTWLARRWHEDVASWAAEPSLGWALLALVGYAAALGLVVRSFPLLRETRLHALAFALVPLAVVQFLHHSQLAGTDDGQKLLGDAQKLLGTLSPEDMVDRAPSVLERAYAWLLLVAPLGLMAAGLVPAQLSVKGVRLASAAIVLAQAVAVGCLCQWGPEFPRSVGAAGTALGVVAGAGALLALIAWRSVGGMGGSVAGVHLLLLVAGLAHLGTGFVPLLRWLYLEKRWLTLDQVAWGELAPGTDRLLLVALPLLAAVLVAREWIAGLSHRTSHDALTDIYNKAYAESILEEAGAMDLGSTYSVALADIDHFKKVNDTHGHGAGDVVLAEVAAAIRETVGTRGVVCRTGGEEITIFFPFMRQDEARGICEHVRRSVEGLTIRCTDNDGRRQRLRCTLSIGVACNVDDLGKQKYEKVRQVVEAADKSVYAAKHAGRNRVVSA